MFKNNFKALKVEDSNVLPGQMLTLALGGSASHIFTQSCPYAAKLSINSFNKLIIDFLLVF